MLLGVNFGIQKWVTRHISMLSFKDFLAANITTDETGQQDLTAMKRQCGLVDEDKLTDRLQKAKDKEMVKAHHKKLGADPQAPAQVKKAEQERKVK